MALQAPLGAGFELRARSWVGRYRRACRTARFPAAPFTPAAKHEGAHDVSISPAAITDLVGARLRDRSEEASRDLYDVASGLAMRRGISIADTWSACGLIDGELVLIGDMLTPNRSRFWGAERFSAEGGRERFDKQDLRDWLAGSAWDKRPPGPPLRNEVAERTDFRYAEAYGRLTRSPLLPVGSEEEW